MRLRQVALAARELAPVADRLAEVLDLEVAFQDPGVATFGLENAVLPVGDTFLEVVSPVRADAPAARWLERHGGDGGYMVIVQSADLAADRARLARLGVRIVWEVALDDIATLHLHPRDVGGAILSLDEARPPESWRWAGPAWQAHRRTGVVTGLAGAELAVHDPGRVAARWAEVLDRPLRRTDAGLATVFLEDGALRFTAAGEEPEGVVALELREASPGALRRRAEAVGAWDPAGFAPVGGVRLRPLPG